MHVLVAGSTGVLGRRLVSGLTDDGYDVVGLVREDTGADLVRERGGEPRRGDVLEPDSLVDAAAGSDVVIHAATAIPTGTRPTPEDWRRNDRIRLEGTRNLLAAAEAVDADRFLLQSVTWVARQPDGSHFDERSDPHPDRTTRSALEAERLLANEATERGLEPCTLRCGWFYAHDAAHTRDFGGRVLERDMPVVGCGLLGRSDATLSFLHADDAASAFAAATASDATGRFHVVDDRPATLADFFETFATLLEAPSPRRVPGWLARPILGRDTTRFLTSSAPTTNERFREAVDWEPSFPTYEHGLEQVLERWLADGTIRSSASDEGYEWGPEN